MSVSADHLTQPANGRILLSTYLATGPAMPASERVTTTVSTKGQVILPKAIRQSLRWDAGTRLVVESTREGVLLRPFPRFAETRPEDVFEILAYDGPSRTLGEMEAGILAEAKRRYAGD